MLHGNEFEQIFNAASDGMRVVDCDRNVIRVNAAYAVLAGARREDLTGRKCHEVFICPDQNTSRCCLARMLLGEERFITEMKQERPEGERLHFLVTSVVFRGADSRPAGIIQNFHDITERRQVEAALRESEARYHGIFDHSGAPAAIIEEDLLISLSNPKFQELTGYGAEEIDGRMKFTELVAPADLEKMIGYYRERRKQVREISVERRKKTITVHSEHECGIVDNLGNVKDILLKVGEIPGGRSCIASLIDITSHRRAQEALREGEKKLSAIVESLGGYIYTATRDYRIDFMNRALVSRYGRDGTGERCHKVIHGLAEPCPSCDHHRIFAGQSITKEIKSPKDGRWFHIINSPICDEQGAVVKRQSLLVDITERKLAEERIQESENRLRAENLQLMAGIKDRYKFGEIVGKSQAMQKVYDAILQAAASEANVIIYGESGTGKELVARAVHQRSSRRNKEFISVNCGAIPEQLLESEFFGHRKGAFTGAVSDKRGLLDLADDGTLFLDEIGEISLALQVKLLRVLEGGGFTPVGGGREQQADVRIIAATNQDLARLVARGKMRVDFFYRIHIIPINLPPLKERREDIPLLADHFMQSFPEEKRQAITWKIMDALMRHDWPGNVRELRNAIHRYLTLGELDFMGPRQAGAEGADLLMEPDFVSKIKDYQSALVQFEKNLITSMLEKNKWHREKTARDLGLNRRTFFRKLNKLGLIGLE